MAIKLEFKLPGGSWTESSHSPLSSGFDFTDDMSGCSAGAELGFTPLNGETSINALFRVEDEDIFVGVLTLSPGQRTSTGALPAYPAGLGRFRDITLLQVTHGDIESGVSVTPAHQSTFAGGDDVQVSWSCQDLEKRVDVYINGSIVADQVLAASGFYTVEQCTDDIEIDVVAGAQKTLATHWKACFEFDHDVLYQGERVRRIEGSLQPIAENAQSQVGADTSLTDRAALIRVVFCDSLGVATRWNGNISGYTQELPSDSVTNVGGGIVEDRTWVVVKSGGNVVPGGIDVESGETSWSWKLDVVDEKPVYVDEEGGPEEPPDPPESPNPSTVEPHEPEEGEPPETPQMGTPPGPGPEPTPPNTENCVCSPWYVDIAESINYVGEENEFLTLTLDEDLQYIGQEIEFLEGTLWEGVQVLDSIQDGIVDFSDRIFPVLERIAVALEKFQEEYQPVDVSVTSDDVFTGDPDNYFARRKY